MQMKDRLPSATAAVEDHPVAVSQLPLGGQLRCHPNHAAQQLSIAGSGLGKRSDVLPRADQKMRRRLRVDIFESKDLGVFVDDSCWRLFTTNLAKNAIAHSALAGAGVSTGARCPRGRGAVRKAVRS